MSMRHVDTGGGRRRTGSGIRGNCTPNSWGVLPPPPTVDRGGHLATDEDRDAATALREALVSGQLTFDEHEERMSAALEARSLQELDDTTREIQRPTQPPHKRRRTGFLVTVAVVRLAGVVAITVAHTCTSPVTPTFIPTVTATSGGTTPQSEANRLWYTAKLTAAQKCRVLLRLAE